MAKPITAIRIRKDRAELLREKAMELTVQKKEYVKEADLVNFLIDEFINRINIDRDGLFVEEEKED
jgi:hypothetical protein